MSQNYGDRLRKRRKIREIAIAELSAATEISQSDLLDIESGLKVLTEDQKQAIEEFIRLRGLARHLQSACAERAA